MAEDDGARPNAAGLGGVFDEEFLREIQARENSTTGDRDIDKVDRRICRAFREIVLSINPALISTAADHTKDGEVLGLDGELPSLIERFEAVAADARFAAVAKEIGLSRSIKQLRFLFGSAAVKPAASRAGAAPRDPTATLNLWIVVETAKRARGVDTLCACKLLRKLGGISMKVDAVKSPLIRKMDNVASMRRIHSEETRRISGNFYIWLFANTFVCLRLSEWRESGRLYDTWERTQLAEMAKGAPVVSGNYPMKSPT